MLVRSKSDLLSAPLPLLSLDPMPPVVELSARTGQGLEELEQAIRSALPRQTGEEAYGELLTNARQEEAASRALERLEGAQAGLSAGVTPDALLTDVEEALSALELTAPPCGRTSPPDLPAFLRWKIRSARLPVRALRPSKRHKCLFRQEAAWRAGLISFESPHPP